MATDYATLVEQLGKALDEYGYTELGGEPPGDVPFIAQLVTPRRRGARYMCAVLEAPAYLSGVDDTSALTERIRDILADEPPRAVFKDLGTYLVLLCSRALFEALAGREGAFIDRTGLHRNILLGIVLVEVERFDCSGASTWGLWYSGKHYGAIKATVLHWCDERKTEPREPLSP